MAWPVEAAQLEEELAAVKVTKPIYVSGLARSGSTLLHEVVSACPGVATHRIKDFPLIDTPYWWRRATAQQRPSAPRQRPHRDKMMITSESPDAIEEMLWMAFFPRCHDPQVSNVLAADVKNAAFEKFYPVHLRKLLLVERARRYAAKANYHVVRLAYLHRLFPDARFIVPGNGAGQPHRVAGAPASLVLPGAADSSACSCFHAAFGAFRVRPGSPADQLGRRRARAANFAPGRTERKSAGGPATGTWCTAILRSCWPRTKGSGPRRTSSV